MFFILVVFTLIAFIDLKPVLKQRSAGILTAFILVFASAFVLAVLRNYNIQPPSSMSLLGNLIKLMGIAYK